MTRRTAIPGRLNLHRPLSHMRRKLLTFALVAALALAACGRSPRNASPAGEPTGNGHGETGDMGGMPNGDRELSFGSPADPSEAARTIAVQALDTLRFEPPEIGVREGETVTFSVTNPGKAAHDFTLGSAELQSEHEREMTSAGSMQQDTPYSVILLPGETKKLAWRFTTRGEVLYGCHQPGHYQGGMVGTITVS